jgi:hypothetical protein
MLFNRAAPDGALWGVIMEKVWAKVNGNYEFINYGWQAESYHSLTGAAATLNQFSSIGYNTATIWTAVSQALANGFLVGVDTGSSSKYNLPTSHAYSVIGAYQLKDASGKVTNTLYRVRNPWGYDVYNGPWCDSSTKWTAAYKA